MNIRTLMSRRGAIRALALLGLVAVIGCNSNPNTASAGNLTATDLGSLKMNVGTLSPTFSKSASAYSVVVPSTQQTVSVKPTTAVASSTIKVNGAVVVSGGFSAPVSLNANGATVITIVVTAEDGISTRTYTVSVTRASA